MTENGHRSDTAVAIQAVDDRLVDGATFILDAPAHVPAIWGRDDEVLWSQGEPCLLVGPPGLGKTTLAQQILLARCGVAADLDVLGYPVTPDPDRFVMYIAADRPNQAARSFRRMVSERHRRHLEQSVLVWRGPLPLDITKQPAEFAAWLKVRGVGTVFIDSLKDIAMPLSDDAVGSAVNSAFQHAIAEGIEVLGNHHQRKAQEGNKKPRSLDDVYGSTWLTAGVGSVVLLWGQPGDAVVELRHLKQPADEVGPLTVEHDHLRGVSRAVDAHNVAELLAGATKDGLTARAVAVIQAGTSEPSRNDIAKARRKLDRLTERGEAHKQEGAAGANAEAARYWPACSSVQPPVQPVPDLHAAARAPMASLHAPCTALHAQDANAATPFKGGRGPERAAHEQAIVAAAQEQLDAIEEPASDALGDEVWDFTRFR